MTSIVVAVVGLVGVLIGWFLNFVTQLTVFTQQARKERVQKLREVIAEFGAAAFEYLDARHEMACFMQRQMNTPFGQSMRSAGSDPDSIRFEEIMKERESRAGTAYWSSRSRLFASQAAVHVLSSDKSIQESARSLWKRLDTLTPTTAVPEVAPGTNPDFANIEVLRAEVDAWLVSTADRVPELFR